MSFTLIAYLLVVIPNIHAMAKFASVVLFIGIPFAYILFHFAKDLHDISETEFAKNMGRIKTACRVFAVSTILTIFMPDSDDLKLIVGAYVADATIESVSKIEGVDKLPANVVNAMNAFLEDIAGDKERAK